MIIISNYVCVFSANDSSIFQIADSDFLIKHSMKNYKKSGRFFGFFDKFNTKESWSSKNILVCLQILTNQSIAHTLSYAVSIVYP